MRVWVLFQQHLAYFVGNLAFQKPIEECWSVSKCCPNHRLNYTNKTLTDNSTYWSDEYMLTTGESSTHWLKMDLGAVHKVRLVEIYKSMTTREFASN